MQKRLLSLAGLFLGAGMVSSLWAQPCNAPTNVTATPSSMCTSGASQLNATSAGNNINWYTVPVGGVSLGTSASGANFAVTVPSTTTYYAEAIGIGGPSTQTFNYTGAVQTFTVPSGVTSLTVDVIGAKGGTGYPATSVGGNGGRVQGTLTVTPGQVLQIYVGGAGANGSANAAGSGGYNGGAAGGLYASSYSGGGGGGASDIRTSPYALANRVVVAGGGGGGAYDYSTTNSERGGDGGGTTGQHGWYGGTIAGQPYVGYGGTPSAGGAGGNYPGYCIGSNGALGVGGAGGTCTNSGGGGGGGYYGGGGGVWGGGGGGSSFLSGGTHTQGYQNGNGQVVLTWAGSGGCTASPRTPVTVTVSPITAPSNVTATPSSICPGATSNLSGISGGTDISWYDAPSGGTLLGSSASGANFPVTPSTTTTYYAESTSGSSSGSQTFNYTGAVQTFTVPSGVTSITVDARGAKGGFGYPSTCEGGNGGRVQGTITVTPGQVLQVYVGGVGSNGSTGVAGAGGFNGGGLGGLYSGSYSGGGGGGASDIRTSPYALANRLAVAGGGGGGAYDYSFTNSERGGDGGGTTGQDGWYNGTIASTPYVGYGGTQSAGGAGGNYPGYCIGSNGALGVGGAGGTCTNSGGGGGGGYYGGGGGVWGGGGGGSSYLSGGTHTQGFQTGAGQVVLSWSGVGCTSASRTPVTVSIETTPPTAVCQSFTLQLDSTGNGTLTSSDVDNGSTDNCSIASMTVNPSSFTCSNAGSNTVILLVTDGAGNTATCTATVTVMGPAINNAITAATDSCGFNVTCANGSNGIATATTTGGCPGYTYVWSNGGSSNIGTALGAGTHYVTITDGAGTVLIDSVVLTAPPAITVQATTTNACPGGTDGTIDVTVSGGNSCAGGLTYLWSNGPTTEDQTGLGAGTYILTVTDGSGCTTSHTVTVSAFVLNPAFTVAGNVLTSTQTWTSYQWLLNGSNISGANAMSYTATTSGVYSLSVTDANGCTAVSDTIQVTLVGVNNPGGDWSDLSLYPNPTRGQFKIRTGSPISYGITVTIHDLAGRKLYEQALPELSDEAVYDVQRFSAGTYMVEVRSEMGQQKLFRLVIQ